MGGMAAQIPVKNQPAANDEAFAKVRADKEREARDGHDGGEVDAGDEGAGVRTAREAANKAIHQYADWLEKRLKTMPPFAPMGDARRKQQVGEERLSRARGNHDAFAIDSNVKTVLGVGLEA